MIVTAIVHPEGVAPFFQGGWREAGNWITDAIPGLRSWREAREGPRRIEANLLSAIGVVGFGFWIYWFTNDLRPRPPDDLNRATLAPDFVPDSGFVRLLLSLALFWAVMVIIAAVRFGGINPSFGKAGVAWANWVKKFGPAAAIGAAWGAIGIWPLGWEDRSMLWVPLLGAGIGLFIRSIVVQIMAARAGDDTVDPPEIHLPGDDIDPATNPEISLAADR